MGPDKTPTVTKDLSIIRRLVWRRRLLGSVGGGSVVLIGFPLSLAMCWGEAGIHSAWLATSLARTQPHTW